MNEFHCKLWRKLGIDAFILWDHGKKLYLYDPGYSYKMKFWGGWVVDPVTQDGIFRVPLSGPMNSVSHYALPRFSSNWSKRVRPVQSTHHSHSPDCSMAPQIMVAKANKTNKNKITVDKKIFWKKELFFFLPSFCIPWPFPF